MNIYELIRGRKTYLPEAKIKSYMYQLCKSMEHMHRNGIFHRDIKPEVIDHPQDHQMMISLCLEPVGAGRRSKVGGFWIVQRDQIEAAIHRIHLHEVVSRARMSIDERVLQLQDGHVGRRMRHVRDHELGSTISGKEQSGPDPQDPSRSRNAACRCPHQTQKVGRLWILIIIRFCIYLHWMVIDGN